MMLDEKVKAAVAAAVLKGDVIPSIDGARLVVTIPVGTKSGLANERTLTFIVLDRGMGREPYVALEGYTP